MQKMADKYAFAGTMLRQRLVSRYKTGAMEPLWIKEGEAMRMPTGAPESSSSWGILGSAVASAMCLLTILMGEVPVPRAWLSQISASPSL